MATTKPRLALTLEPEQYQILQRLAAVQGGSMARIVSEMLSEMLPMLTKVTEAMEAAQKAHEGMKASIRTAAEQAERDMQPLVATAIAQFDHFARQMDRLVESGGGTPVDHAGLGRPSGVARGRRKPAGAPADPRPVTRGLRNSGKGVRGGAADAAGVVWWNGLTESERAEWCRKSGSAVPADAWALFTRMGG